VAGRCRWRRTALRTDHDPDVQGHPVQHDDRAEPSGSPDARRRGARSPSVLSARQGTAASKNYFRVGPPILRFPINIHLYSPEAAAYHEAKIK